MDPERRRRLQDERVRALVAGVFERPVPLFREKLAQAGVESPKDIAGVDDLWRVPLTVKQDLRDSEAADPPWGAYRFTDPRHAVRLGTSTGTTGQPTITVWTRKDVWIEYESGRPQLVAHGLPPRDDRDPRPPRLPLRRRGHAPGHLRVHGPAQPLGAPARHRRAGRAGRAVLDPGHPGHPLHGLRHRAVHRGGHQAGHPPGGRRAHRPEGAAGVRARARGHAPHDGGGRVLRLRRRAVRPVARGPHPRGLGRGPGGRPGHRPGGGRRRVGQPHGDHPRPGQRPAPLRPRGGLRHRARALPLRGDLHPRACGAAGSRTC